MLRFGLQASGLLFATALLAHGCASDDAEAPVVVEPLAKVRFAELSETQQRQRAVDASLRFTKRRHDPRIVPER